MAKLGQSLGQIFQFLDDLEDEDEDGEDGDEDSTTSLNPWAHFPEESWEQWKKSWKAMETLLSHYQLENLSQVISHHLKETASKLRKGKGHNLGLSPIMSFLEGLHHGEEGLKFGLRKN